MKVLSLFMFFALTILACDTVEEEFLYDKDDPEYTALQELAAAKCVEEASIFPYLDGTGAFETAGMDQKIYKITQDVGSATILYMKVINVTATEMLVQVNSPDDTYDKVITFEKTDHDALLAELKIASCNLNYQSFYSAAGLTSKTAMTLTWKKETINVVDGDDSDTEPEVYDRREDSYTFSASYPLFFFFYNGTKVSKRVLTDNADEVVVTSKLSIEEVTSKDECNTSLTEEEGFNRSCDFSTTAGFDICDLDINTGLYNSNKYADEILSYTGVDACERLRSAI